MIKRLVAIVCIIICSSCVEQLDLNVESNNNILIVDGQISNLHTAYVNLSRSAPFKGELDGGVEQPVSGATIWIEDNFNRRIDLVETSAGKYTSNSLGSVGRTYKLFIRTADGRNLQSSTQLLNEPVPIEDLKAITGTVNILNPRTKLKQERIAKHIKSTFTFPDDSYVRWRWEYTQDTINEKNECVPIPFNTFRDVNYVEVERAKDYKSPQQVDFPVYDLVCPNSSCERFCYTFTLYQYNINQDSYDFWLLAEQQRSIDGSVFDVPPSKIIGNMTNIDDPDETILGVFSAVGMSTKQLEFRF